MVKFPFPTRSLKCAMSVAALPGGMLGARRTLRPLPLSLVGWCASFNNNNNNDNDNILREMGEGANKRETWRWLRKADQKVETEALICAAHEQTLRTNYVKFNMDKNGECRMCGKTGRKCESYHK